MIRKKLRKAMSFTISSKRMKYLDINLPKEVNDLYTENYKNMDEEIEDYIDK